LREVFSFSRNISIGRISWYAYTNADFIVAGKVLGSAALGAYSFAWSLANIATNKVTAQVGKVTPAFFSAVQHDNRALSRYLLIITEGLAMITMPVTLGLYLIADDFVLLILGNQWRPVIMPLRLLLIYACCRSMMTLPPQILNVKGKSQFVMVNNLIGAVLLPIMFYVGSFWGTVGIASAWLVWFPLIALPVFQQVFRVLKLSSLDYFSALRPAVTASAAMALVIWTVRFMIQSDGHMQERMILSVVAGGGVYCAALLLLYREKAKDCLDALRALYAGARRSVAEI
jgi:PST family polysaccharide transporter